MTDLIVVYNSLISTAIFRSLHEKTIKNAYDIYMSVAPSKTISLYLTSPDECSYLDDRKQRMLLVDPEEQLNSNLATYFSNHFKPSRSQRRLLNKNKNISITLESIDDALDYFPLYYEYQKARHKDGTMCDSSEEKYLSFIQSDFFDSALMVRRDGEDVVSVSILDLFNDGVSLLYTFFNPEKSHLSPGTSSILDAVAYCEANGFQYAYLGFWIADSQKMNYKTKFQPLQGYIDNEWKPLEK